MSGPGGSVPPEAKVSTHRHRVAFFETDAMGVVHHSNYVRFLETGRIHWMDRFHEPYRRYVERDLHFAVTRVEVRYLLAAAFDDELEVSTWLDAIRGASLRMSYRIERGGELVATATTEHAMVDGGGRLRRIPRELRERLAEQAAAKEWR